jgi:hypothetical protein
VVVTNISEEFIALYSGYKTGCSEDGDGNFLLSAGNHLRDYTVSYPDDYNPNFHHLYELVSSSRLWVMEERTSIYMVLLTY